MFCRRPLFFFEFYFARGSVIGSLAPLLFFHYVIYGFGRFFGLLLFFWRLFWLYARALQPQHGQLHRMHHYETGNKQYCQIQYSYRFHDCIIQRRRAYILPLLRE